MRYIITGVAGFIGSTLADELLATGHEVIGIDCFTEYYEAERKRENLDKALQSDRFRLIEEPLEEAPLLELLDDVEAVFHQAGEPGVRGSWRDGFSRYEHRNIHATQRLLEAVRQRPGVGVVYASSSSVYGNSETWPCVESQAPSPYSPYGVTKLAAEHLVRAYSANFGIPAVALRYFTVYGPRQRPDMLMHRLCESALTRQPVTIYGDGLQIRDFTYVADVVQANILSAKNMPADQCEVLNICGGTSASLADVLSIIGATAGQEIPTHHGPAQSGDVPRTGGSAARAEDLLGWTPSTSLEVGLRNQLQWHIDRDKG